MAGTAAMKEKMAWSSCIPCGGGGWVGGVGGAEVGWQQVAWNPSTEECVFPPMPGGQVSNSPASHVSHYSDAAPLAHLQLQQVQLQAGPGRAAVLKRCSVLRKS